MSKRFEALELTPEQSQEYGDLERVLLDHKERKVYGFNTAPLHMVQDLADWCNTDPAELDGYIAESLASMYAELTA